MVSLKKKVNAEHAVASYKKLEWHPALHQTPEQRIRYNLILKNLRKAKGSRVLDLGCGTGCLGRLLELRGNAVVYADLGGRDTVSYMRTWRKVWATLGERILCDGSRLPFRESVFDYVNTVEVLEHVPSDRRFDFIKEIARVCKKEVHMAFSTLCSTSPQIELFKMMFKALHVSLSDFTFYDHELFPLPKVSFVREVFRQQDFKIVQKKLYHGSVSMFCLGFRTALYHRVRIDRFPFILCSYPLAAFFYFMEKLLDFGPYTNWYLRLMYVQSRKMKAEFN